MKVVTFFNEKGGSAKSTFSTLFASWLQYENGINTAVVDIDNRIARDRKIQERYWPEASAGNKWDIFDINSDYLKKLNQKYHLSIKRYADWFKTFAMTGQFKKYDIMIIDFPGSMDDFMDFFNEELLSLIIVPVDRDPHILTTTIRLGRFLKLKDIPCVGFINKAQSFGSLKIYEDIKDVHRKHSGLKILPDMVSFSERVNKSMTEDTPPQTIIRSTLSYPDWSNKAFEGAGDLGIDNLLKDIAKELVKCKDLSGTRASELNFKVSLEKTFHERRQLKNTDFPEYEFDETYYKNKKAPAKAD